MPTIGELLTRDLSQPIEEVIKLDQQDEQIVYNEISEYVATSRIKEQYRTLLQAIADAPAEPHEGIGVWISGFFGSGKSAFAKNLGYVLANRSVLGRPAADLFVQRLREQTPGDPLVDRIADLVDFVKARTPSHVIMFDVRVDQAVRQANEPIAEIMYSVLLRELDYAADYDIANLEIDLEAEGRLAGLVHTCADLYSDVKPATGVTVPVTLEGVAVEEYAIWSKVRKTSEAVPRISAALHELEPTTYPESDTWLRSLSRGTDVSIRQLVDRTFDLAARRMPGRAIVFIIDEIGGYVARSVEKIEDLRAVAEHFGQEGRNRVLARQAVAPVWLIVTSQEKLNEVVAAIDDKRVELARLQDRFHYRIDMAPADIREVATKRVLSKRPEGEAVLRDLYRRAEGRLKTNTRLERTSLPMDLDEASFVQHYPYLPHFIDLSIDIVSGLRLEQGAPRHIGGSNRTIIKQAYEMLVSDRTNLADAPVGELVTLDRIYDLVEGNMSSAKQRDIGDILQRWADDPWPARVAKAIALLEPVRDLPCTEANLAALLCRNVEAPSPLAEVQRALELLREHQFIRQTEQGWKLQTAEEKSWAAERGALAPLPRERNLVLEKVLQGIFSDPALNRYHFKSLRHFRVGVRWDDRAITTGDAQVPLELRLADGADHLADTCERARDDSRSEAHQNQIYWVTALNDAIDNLTAEVCRSQAMVARYEQLRAQNKLNKEEASSLAAEKTEALRYEERLKEEVLAALRAGKGYFRGVEKDGAALGKTWTEIQNRLFEYAVPDLYPKLELGARSLKGDEAEQVLKAANLNGLPKVFYGPPDGLELVIQEGSKTVVNAQAPIAQEVLQFLQREHSYGNKVTGRVLEDHFAGIGYGWDREMLWLVLATLLRAGAIEITYQGRRFRNHLDPQARTPFSGTNPFRAASFAPRKAPDLTTLVNAAKRYEELTGEEVDVDEAAIAQALQKLARAELEALLPVEATVRANSIPLEARLQEYHTWLETILNSASDDCVNTLAGEGASLQEMRSKVAAIRKATGPDGLARLQRMRAAEQQIWPRLQQEGLDGELSAAAGLLRERLEEGRFYETDPAVDSALGSLEAAYRKLYGERHQDRQDTYTQAIEAVRGHSAWAHVPDEMRADVLRPLAGRADHDLQLPEDALLCTACHATLSEMASDVAAADSRRSSVLLRVQELTAPEEKIERVKVASVAGARGTLSTSKEVEDVIERLRDHLLKLVAAGVKIVLE